LLHDFIKRLSAIAFAQAKRAGGYAAKELKYFTRVNTKNVAAKLRSIKSLQEILLPNRLKHTCRPPDQNDDHRSVRKNNGELRPEQDTKGLGQSKNERTHHGTPHIAQSPNGHDKEGFNDHVMIHAQRNAYGGRNQSATKSSKITAEHKGKGKYPAHVDAYGAHHLHVNGCCTGYLSHFGLSCEEPEGYGHKGTNNEEKEVVTGNG
jgi:hypothetical protein